ncbi:MAG: hypothetical protein ACREGC_00840 [Minisyncoccia bacterium]
MTHGETETVGCAVEPAMVTVKLGRVVAGAGDKIVDAMWFPDNCPRGPYYDAAKKVGCLSCVQARSVDADGAILEPIKTYVAD